jgi:hypothetical protein
MNPETWKRARLIAIREFDRDLSNEEILMLDTITAASSDGERNLLMSALHELRDKELSQAEKTSAWSRLQTFVAKASPTLGRSLLSVLEKYLAYKLTTP